MEQFTIENWTVCPGQNTISRDTTVRRVEPRVMDLINYFAKHPGEVLSHDRILANVWPHTYVSDSALQTAISALRKAFDDDPRKPAVLETIPKRGYRLIANTSTVQPVIAVLPFKDLTGVPDQEYLVDGITDTLIAELGRIPSVRVVSRHSVMLYRESTLRLPRIAAELNAQYVVEGSVLPDGEDLCMTTQVINAVADTHVWSETYRIGRRRPLEMQRTIAKEIAGEVAQQPLEVAVGSGERQTDPDAVTQYLRGRFHWYKLHPAHFQRALEHFEKAVEIAPDFGAAYAGIADVWGALGYWGLLPAAEAGSRVKAALDKAIAVDPDSPEVNMLLGAYHFFCEYDWDAAHRRLDRAIELNADLAHARLLSALLHGTLRSPAAFDQIDHARRLDPLNVATMLGRAMCLAGAERYEEVEAELEQLLDLDPAFGPAIELRAELAWIRRADDAISRERQVWQADRELSDLFSSPAAFRDPAATLLAGARLLERRRQESYVAPRTIARLYSLAGSPEAAIDVLEAAVAGKDLMQVDFVQLTPAFAAVRRCSRFRSLAKTIGLPREPLRP